MLRSFLGVGGVLSALVMSAGCHACLDGQDLGPGSGAGGNGGQAAQTTTSDGTGTPASSGTEATSSNVSTSSGSTGGGGMGQGGGCIEDPGIGGGTVGSDECSPMAASGPICTGPTPCQLADGLTVFNFGTECAHDEEWCLAQPTMGTHTVDLTGTGQLRISTEGRTGFWSPETTPSLLEFPPYLYRTVPADRDFVVATEIQSITISAGNYNVAGIVVRNPADAFEPGGGLERWVKLEYGRRGSSDYPGLGIMVGEGLMGGADQIGGSPVSVADPQLTANLRLGMCRTGGELEFYADRGAGWEAVFIEPGERPRPFVSNVEVGLTAGAYNEPDTTTAEFEWVRFLVGEDLSGCTCLGHLDATDGGC